jgi:DNA repair exonuclease SbcCD ATPase subunit
LNGKIEEQILVSSVTSKQDLHTAIKDLKENLNQLRDNNENTNVEEITKSMDESFNTLENFASLIESQEQNYGKLKIETAKLNQNLANVTLLLDEEHKRKMKDDEVNMKEIQRLQQMASTLNNALSRVTLLCDEIKRDSTSAGIENLNVQVQNTRNLPLDDSNDNPEVDHLRENLASINTKLANVTLLCDQINKEKKKNITDLEQQVEHFKNLTVELNSRITDLTYYCDQVEHEKSVKEEVPKTDERIANLSQEISDYKLMLEQKDLVIQQLQSQIEELEHKSMSNKEDMETINLLIQENAALKQRISELDHSDVPLDLTSPIDEVQHFVEEEIIEYDGNVPENEQETY